MAEPTQTLRRCPPCLSQAPLPACSRHTEKGLLGLGEGNEQSLAPEGNSTPKSPQDSDSTLTGEFLCLVRCPEEWHLPLVSAYPNPFASRDPHLGSR